MPLEATTRLRVKLGLRSPGRPTREHSPEARRLEARQLVELYGARFQLGFLFRDSQQFTGLLDWQARAASALDCHVNASLATLNRVRAEDLGRQQGQEPPAFSMASWKQLHFNERLLDLFMEHLALDPTWVKNHACYEELRTYGAIAA